MNDETPVDNLEEMTNEALEIAFKYDRDTACMALSAAMVGVIAAAYPHEHRVPVLEHYVPNMRSLLKHSPVTFDDTH